MENFKNQTFGMFNPNQRQFHEDSIRYREKIQQLESGFHKNSQISKISHPTFSNFN